MSRVTGNNDLEECLELWSSGWVRCCCLSQSQFIPKSLSSRFVRL